MAISQAMATDAPAPAATPFTAATMGMRKVWMDLALAQAAQVICLWSDRAFAQSSPLARVGAQVILRPDVGDIIRAAYHPMLPKVAHDASHALRIAARLP